MNMDVIKAMYTEYMKNKKPSKDKEIPTEAITKKHDAK